MVDSLIFKPTVFVVIAVHNRRVITSQCLEKLQKQSYNPVKIIVIDDGSTDGTAEMIRKDYPNVIILIGDGNFWWSKSMNTGINYVLKQANESDLVLTLNDDTFFDIDYIKTIVNDINNNPNTILGSLILINGTNNVFFAGSLFHEWTGKDKPNFQIGEKFKSEDNQFLNTDYLPGRGTVIPVYIFNKIGLFDDIKLPHYLADYDFTLRAKKNGIKLIVNTKMIIKTNLDRIIVEKNTNIRTLLRSLFDIKSSSRLIDLYMFAKNNAKWPLFYFMLNASKTIIKGLIKF